MEKILLALDAHQLETNTIDFACFIAKLAGSKLTGVFLEDVRQKEMTYVADTARPTCIGRPERASYEQEEGPVDIVSLNIKRFKESCVCRETTGLIHRDRGIPLSEVVEESRFADLIIVDPVTSFSKSNRGVPSRFVKDVLLDSECPVLIAPYSFDGLDKVIFAYNGTQSSVFAIKQFTYLFPGLSDRKAIVVNVSKDDKQSIE